MGVTKDADFLFDMLDSLNINQKTHKMLTACTFDSGLPRAALFSHEYGCFYLSYTQAVIDDATELLASEAAGTGRRMVRVLLLTAQATRDRA